MGLQNIPNLNWWLFSSRDGTINAPRCPKDLIYGDGNDETIPGAGKTRNVLEFFGIETQLIPFHIYIYILLYIYTYLYVYIYICIVWLLQGYFGSGDFIISKERCSTTLVTFQYTSWLIWIRHPSFLLVYPSTLVDAYKLTVVDGSEIQSWFIPLFSPFLYRWFVSDFSEQLHQREWTLFSNQDYSVLKTVVINVSPRTKSVRNWNWTFSAGYNRQSSSSCKDVNILRVWVAVISGWKVITFDNGTLVPLPNSCYFFEHPVSQNFCIT